MYKESIPSKKGGGKKKGAAESVKQEKKDLNKMPGDVKQMDTPPARKKGASRTVEQLKAKKQEMQETRADKKMGVKAYNKKIGRLNKKIERKGGTVPGVAKYQEEGAADFKGGLHAKNTKHSESGEHLGAKRMGFTQNFGPARQNSYAQGAAKVASIMSFGASKKKGVADHIVGHPASEVKLDNIAPSGGIKTSDAKQYIKDLIKSQSEYDVNTTQTSQNLAELDSLKMVASGNAQKAKSLYGYQYTSDKELNTNFDKSAYDPHMRGHSNPHGKKRSDKYKQLKKDAKVIQGPRPTL